MHLLTKYSNEAENRSSDVANTQETAAGPPTPASSRSTSSYSEDDTNVSHNTKNSTGDKFSSSSTSAWPLIYSVILNDSEDDANILDNINDGHPINWREEVPKFIKLIESLPSYRVANSKKDAVRSMFQKSKDKSKIYEQLKQQRQR